MCCDRVSLEKQEELGHLDHCMNTWQARAKMWKKLARRDAKLAGMSCGGSLEGDPIMPHQHDSAEADEREVSLKKSEELMHNLTRRRSV